MGALGWGSVRLTDLLQAVVGVLTRPADRKQRDATRPSTPRDGRPESRPGGRPGSHPESRPSSGTQRSGSSSAPTHRDESPAAPRPAAPSSGSGSGSREYAAPVKGIVNYDLLSAGRPRISYAPEDDGDPDPGEVVWGWVPYEDDPQQGKDRPILIIGHGGDALVGIQLTSKDRATGGRAGDADGRVWMDVGTGPWDRKQRPSEVRLDRLLRVEARAVRREGGALARDRFDAVVVALGEHHSW